MSCLTGITHCILAAVARDVLLDRCDSHNAFKCYGQCGKTECMTHFQDESDLIDHVIEGKALFSPCKLVSCISPKTILKHILFLV